MSHTQHFLFIALFSFTILASPIAKATDFSLPAASDIPSAHAIKGWQEVPYYTTYPMNLNATPKLTLNCNSPKLYPTHADQILKHYHQFNSTSYDNTKLKHDDYVCLTPSRSKNSSGQYYCMRSDVLYTTVISDTFRDRCGNFYRGYTRVTYLHQDENMGTLFSRGRTMYPKPRAEYPGDVEMGATYETDIADFIFLGSLLQGDAAAIQKSFIDNQKTYLRFDANTLLFKDIR